MPKLKFTITMSLDGYVAGPAQGPEDPLGVGGVALHEWAFATRTFREAHDLEGAADGETGLDDEHAAAWNANVGIVSSFAPPRRLRRTALHLFAK